MVRLRDLLLVCLAGVIWGTIGPAVQLVDDSSGLAPLATSAYRAIIAVVVLAATATLLRRLRTCLVIVRQHWRRVTVIGLLTASFQALFFVAVPLAGVSVATVVCLGVAPVLLLVIGAVRRRRRPTPGQILTVAAAVIGLVLISATDGAADQAPHAALGILAALASGVAFALSAEVARPLSEEFDGLSIATATMCVAAAALVPGGLLITYARGDVLTTTDPASWLLIAYLGGVTMALAYVLLFVGLRSTPASTAVVATLLEPVTAVLIAVAFLGERMTPAGAVGALLILIAIGSLRNRPEDVAPR